MAPRGAIAAASTVDSVEAPGEPEAVAPLFAAAAPEPIESGTASIAAPASALKSVVRIPCPRFPSGAWPLDVNDGLSDTTAPSAGQERGRNPILWAVGSGSLLGIPPAERSNGTGVLGELEALIDDAGGRIDVLEQRDSRGNLSLSMDVATPDGAGHD